MWDLFLMKFLLKKWVCGSCEQCTGPTREKLKKKGKKKKKKRGRRRRVNVERNPNGALVIVWKAFSPSRLRLVFKR